MLTDSTQDWLSERWEVTEWCGFGRESQSELGKEWWICQCPMHNSLPSHGSSNQSSLPGVQESGNGWMTVEHCHKL